GFQHQPFPASVVRGASDFRVQRDVAEGSALETPPPHPQLLVCPSWHQWSRYCRRAAVDMLLMVYRTIVVVMAADGVSDAFGGGFLAALSGLGAALVLEIVLGIWFLRHPLVGNTRVILFFVVLRFCQPVIWTLAAVGIIAPM